MNKILEKIDEAKIFITTRSDNTLEIIEISKLKEIIQTEQDICNKCPSEYCVVSLGEECPLKGFNSDVTDIDVTNIDKTKGDLIRESNESLIKWIEMHQEGLFNSNGRTYESCVQVIREHLNQKAVE